MPKQRQGRSWILGTDRWETTAVCAVALVTIVLAAPLQAQTFTVIHKFTGPDGANPEAGLTMNAAGDLYGTTEAGGADGVGNVFRLRYSGSGWVLNTLHSFTGHTDGAYPLGRVALAPDGTLYGTTSYGGGIGCGGGCGTVFHLTPPPTAPRSALAPWNEAVLYGFTGGSDGRAPQGDLTLDASGNIYGTTEYGGSTNCTGGVGGCGVVYELSPSSGGWTPTVLYSPQNNGDGANPLDGVVFDKSGNLYGVFENNGPFNWGAVYQLSPSGSGWSERTAYAFMGGSGGGIPRGGLIFDASGNLWGTTSHGGDNGGGTVFQLSPSNGGWNFNLLYGLSGQYFGGPTGKLVMDAAGNLYGTTYSDGAYGYGSVFELTPGSGGWTYTSLHDFTGPEGDDGYYPVGGVVLDADGNLYGATYQSYSGTGLVYKITP